MFKYLTYLPQPHPPALVAKDVTPRGVKLDAGDVPVGTEGLEELPTNHTAARPPTMDNKSVRMSTFMLKIIKKII